MGNLPKTPIRLEILLARRCVFSVQLLIHVSLALASKISDRILPQIINNLIYLYSTS